MTAVNLSLPVRGPGLVLGTWQGIYLWEHRTRPHSFLIREAVEERGRSVAWESYRRKQAISAR